MDEQLHDVIDIIENQIDTLKRRLEIERLHNNNKFSDIYESLNRLRAIIENQITEPLQDGIPITQCNCNYDNQCSDTEQEDD